MRPDSVQMTSTAHDTLENPAPKRTVQLTSKRLKAHYAAAVLAAVVGFFMFWTNFNAQPQGTEATGSGGALTGLMLGCAGAFWMVVTKVRIWWNHG